MIFFKISITINLLIINKQTNKLSQTQFEGNISSDTVPSFSVQA